MTSQHTMSPDLIAFLKAWHDWATNGAPDGEPFSRNIGLCGSAMRFADDDVLADRLWDELRQDFGTSYPFGGSRAYEARYFASTQHECPKRLAWVRERLIEAGELRNCDDCGFSTTERNVTVCPDRACRGSVA